MFGQIYGHFLTIFSSFVNFLKIYTLWHILKPLIFLRVRTGRDLSVPAKKQGLVPFSKQKGLVYPQGLSVFDLRQEMSAC